MPTLPLSPREMVGGDRLIPTARTAQDHGLQSARQPWETVVVETPRYRLDFVVPENHDIAEEHFGLEVPVTPPPRNETLDRLRAALADDPRWERSMLAPWRPFGQQQHLIVWIDLTQPESEIVVRDAVSGIVNDFLPGVTLAEMVKNPF
jgi:hypothetical protein